MDAKGDQFDHIKEIQEDINSFPVTDAASLEQFRIRFLGSKNILKDVFSAIKDVPNERKKEFGQLVNALKQSAEQRFEILEAQYKKQSDKSADQVDVSRPAITNAPGSLHPVTLIKDELIGIFTRMGYTVVDGPEIEDDWHNFSALGMPEDHPARDMQDTFYISTNPAVLLRTHTSNVQIRVMEELAKSGKQPPVRIVALGRTYRNETISARAHCTFNQIELLYIDEGVTFADMKQTLLYLAQELYGENTTIRLRPSYFPFTEPSAEMDVSCFVCGGDGCAICKHSGWVEIGGCGMVDPVVLENCGIDSEKYTGFAFGFGLERIAILKYKINDIRLFTENDLRFLKQFEQL
ncbi:MAG TPA: phenylalanine--tRNA ligase subunit alpha [Chitinophagales bacterium]|nr:phenylalanine--tRNA ligase subunit alpha [Chitinophagales bacterium]HNA59366.1 phenylalanine--tRNA ligase subunit alpha [Chitinophagales bacterium]HNF70251.1 phenylalanine--tRNA ligase subunit alpha [Chitinophagales bacterium]HNI55067.1 phenylalanine--tRNA ligase subunit alpha [Chitinophagales bacterium]HNJ90451.1 phenylalanine--tRNA ligase subunit alpha [Chitinophagales bacterium]